MTRKPKLKCDIGTNFALAFKAWRQRNGIPLKQIAADLDLSVNTISLWQVGKRFPSKHHLQKLVDYTGLPPCRLFCAMPDACAHGDCLLGMGEIHLVGRDSPPSRALRRTRRRPA